MNARSIILLVALAALVYVGVLVALAVWRSWLLAGAVMAAGIALFQLFRGDDGGGE